MVATAVKVVKSVPQQELWVVSMCHHPSTFCMPLAAQKAHTAMAAVQARAIYMMASTTIVQPAVAVAVVAVVAAQPRTSAAVAPAVAAVAAVPLATLIKSMLFTLVTALSVLQAAREARMVMELGLLVVIKAF